MLGYDVEARDMTFRYRLRFLLQEMEITGSEVVIGRSPTCHITLEDPLVSRKHAIIKIRDEQAVIVDLGSRNGVRLNGRIIQSEHGLRDGDRIRIGTQDLVFLVANQPAVASRPTGFMRVCDACRTPYPEGVEACPHCGAPTSTDDDTVSAIAEPRRAWTLDLLSEVIERALSMGRVQEVEKLLGRAADEVDSRLRAHEKIDAQHLHQVAGYAVQLARLQGEATWVSWATTLYMSHAVFPNDEVASLLVRFCEEFEDRAELRRVITSFLMYLDAPLASGVSGRALAEKLRVASGMSSANSPTIAP